MTRHTPQTPEYIKIDEKSNIDQIGLDHKLSNSAIIGLKEFLNKAKQDKHEDVLYITKEELKEFHGMNIPKRLRYLEKQEERVTDSYELLQDTKLALNLAGGNKEKIAEGRELLQKFSDKIDEMAEDFLFSTHESPLFGEELTLYQKRNLITGLSFYASEIALGKNGLKNTIESGITAVKGGFLTTITAIGSNLTNIPAFFEPFTEVFNTLRDSSGSAMKDTVQKHPQLLSNPLDAKKLIEYVVGGSTGETPNASTEFGAAQKKELSDIGTQWEDIITSKIGGDIKGFSEIIGTTGGKKSIENKLKVFFTTSIGETVKGWIQGDSFLSLIIGGLFSLLGFDMAEILGEDKLDKNNVAAFRVSVVQNFSNIKDAQLLLADKDGIFDEAIAERLYALKKDDEDLIDTLKRIHNNSDFKQIGKKLTSTKGTVQDDAFTVGMDEAINLYYDFDLAKKQAPSLTIQKFIKNKLKATKNDNEVTEGKVKKLKQKAAKPIQQVESVDKQGDSIIISSKVHNQAYETEMRKNGYIVVKSSNGEVVKYQITNSDFVGMLQEEWEKPLSLEQTTEIQKGVNDLIKKGTTKTTPFIFTRESKLSFPFAGQSIEISLVAPAESVKNTTTHEHGSGSHNTSSGSNNTSVTGSGVAASGAAAQGTSGENDASPNSGAQSNKTSKRDGGQNDTDKSQPVTQKDGKVGQPSDAHPIGETNANVQPSSAKNVATPSLEQEPLMRQVEKSKPHFKSKDEIDTIVPSVTQLEKDSEKGKITTVEKTDGGKATLFYINENTTVKVTNSVIFLKIAHEGYSELFEYNPVGTEYSAEDINSRGAFLLGLLYNQIKGLIEPLLTKVSKKVIDLGIDEKTGKHKGKIFLQKKYSSETPELKEVQRKADESIKTSTELPAKKEPEKDDTSKKGQSPTNSSSTDDKPVTQINATDDTKSKEKTERELQEERSMKDVIIFEPEYNGKKGIKGMFKKKEFHIYIQGKDINVQIENEAKYKTAFTDNGGLNGFGFLGDNYNLQYIGSGLINFKSTRMLGNDMTIRATLLIRLIFENSGSPIHWSESPLAGKDMFFEPTY